MINLRSTVIAKTDICGFTARVKTLLESELSDLLSEHKRFVSEIAAKNGGSIVKGEGDSFWIIFPSVTVATLAAVEMHQALRTAQPGKGDHERLTIRVAITLGDVLHQDTDIFGDSVNLAARIEAVTPPDEIYLSHAAWLALNKAEVQTAFVSEFSLKGMNEPERVYKVEQRHKTRVVRNQVIVITDVKGFTAYQRQSSVEAVEDALLALDALVKRVCERYGGVIRIFAGDAYHLTFPEAPRALAAVEELCNSWGQFTRQHQMPCGLAVGVHKGDFSVFRSWLFGDAINLTGRLLDLNDVFAPQKDISSVWVTGKVGEQVKGTSWEPRLVRCDSVDNPWKEFAEKNGVCRFVL